MIRKESRHGVGYSVVDLNGVSHVFAAAVPLGGTTLEKQAHDALRTIEAVIDEEGSRGSIVQQAVFLREAEDAAACRRILRDFYGDCMPATTYISQPPCCDRLLSVEALGVGRGEAAVTIERLDERLIITSHGGISWVHASQIVPRAMETGVYSRTISAFGEMRDLLGSRGIGFDQVIRTWLYLGDIVGMEGEVQRYHELNRARTDFYRGIRFGEAHAPDGIEGPIYPASTGIGSSNHDVVMSCIAVDAPPGRFALLPLENPRQTSACDYSSRFGLESPKFSRAMALASGRCATIFVSGTASIAGSETRWVGDVARQTTETLDNIEALISEDNFARHGWSGLGATLADLAFVRVYIKRQEDYARARAVCEARLGELPSVYAVADVCRPDLLVEIEGIAFSARC